MFGMSFRNFFSVCFRLQEHFKLLVRTWIVLQSVIIALCVV